MEKREKGKEVQRIRSHNWELVAYKNPDGSMMFYLNRIVDGKTHGYIICSKNQLKNLSLFLKERKIM